MKLHLEHWIAAATLVTFLHAAATVADALPTAQTTSTMQAVTELRSMQQLAGATTPPPPASPTSADAHK